MPSLFQRTVNLLQDFMDQESRDTWLTQAFFSGHREIYNAIDKSGAPRNFTTRCIRELHKAGCIDGRHSVSFLIEELKSAVGSDRQRQFDGLIREWDAQCIEQPEEASKSFRKSPSSDIGTDKKQEKHSFDVFLCHNSEDKPEVKGIGLRLKQHDLHPWLDEWELRPGFPWQRLLEEQIENIKAAAVFVGPSGIGPWQKMELEAFLREFVDRGCPVIPVILPGVSEKPRLPLFLRAFTWVDFRKNEPDPLQRLIWGITGEKNGNRTTSSMGSAAQRDAELAYLQELEQKKLHHIQRYYAKMEGIARKSAVREIPQLPAFMMRPEFERLEKWAGDHAGEKPKPRRFDDLVKAFSNTQAAALLGEPGAGKTTTLFKIASDGLERTRKDSEDPVPLLLGLGKWTAPNQKLMTFMKAHLGPLSPYLESLLKSKRAVVLLDGLNEIPVADRIDKIPQIRTFLEDNPEVQIIVSCRDLDYQGPLDLGLDTVTIRPLEPLRIRDFLVAYLGKAKGEDLFWRIAGGEEVLETWRYWEKAGAGFGLFWTAEKIPEEKPNIFWKVPFRTHRIWREVVKSPHNLMGLASNPYMLSMLFQVYLRSGELPANRSALFDDFVLVLLEREHLTDLETTEITPQSEELLSVVEDLAWALQTRGPQRAAETDGVLISLPRAAVDEIMDSRSLRLAASVSLLEIDGEVRFSHQLLQEYFTARRMRERLEKGELDATALWPKERWWARSGWEEAAILLAGFYAGDCTPVLKWLMDANPEVAAQCIERSGAEVPESTLEHFRGIWLPRLTDIENDPNPAARANVGHALGSVRLHDRPLDNRRGVGPRFDPAKKLWLPDIDWVQIPAGPFIYQDGEKQTLPLFYISRYPVTNAQFQAFVDDPKGYNNPRWWEGLAERFEQPAAPWWSHANHPRETVSWYEAMAFCAWLSGRLDTEIRLPTEQEWEKAARGTEGKEYPWGNEYSSGFANINETWGEAGGHNLQQTTAVGLYPQGRSSYGVMDLAGNVWEWCRNKYDEPDDTSIGGKDWRVLRGGSWYYDRAFARASFRNYLHPFNRVVNIGFRVCCFSPID